MVPIHPNYDHHLFGIQWQRDVFIDQQCLPFGLQSAPKLFTAFANMVTWAIHCQGLKGYPTSSIICTIILVIGKQNSCRHAFLALSIALEFFKLPGVPVSDHKMVGSSISMTFLGKVIDTDHFQLHEAANREDRIQLRDLLEVWQSRTLCTCKELESFTGHLAHAAVVIRPGAIFLRSLFSLLSATTESHFYS